jgi:serine/threonine protein kinase
MAVEIGGRVGPYEIVGTLGAGGMGEVYRARDTTLDRDVAIKISPEQFAKDAERLARFTREAKALVALNHPNIAAIHSVEEIGRHPWPRHELCEGPTLAERLRSGALPLSDVLGVAINRRCSRRGPFRRHRASRS